MPHQVLFNLATGFMTNAMYTHEIFTFERFAAIDRGVVYKRVYNSLQDKAASVWVYDNVHNVGDITTACLGGNCVSTWCNYDQTPNLNNFLALCGLLSRIAAISAVSTVRPAITYTNCVWRPIVYDKPHPPISIPSVLDIPKLNYSLGHCEEVLCLQFNHEPWHSYSVT